MLSASMPKFGIILLIIPFLIIILFFKGDVSQRWQRNGGATLSQWKNTVMHDNITNFEHPGVFDTSAEGAAKITQVSMQFGGHFDLSYERALRTHIENGEKWGYPTHFLRQDIVGHGELAEGVYDKLLYLLTIMVNEMTKPFGKRSEWIVWFDADTVLINHEIPWTTFLPPSYSIFQEVNMLVTADWSGFNAGVFLIRVCEWSINVLSDAIALPRLKPELDMPFREQDALHNMYDTPERKKHRLYVPRHWFNVYDEWYAGRGEKVMNGSLIVHFPGMGGARSEAMGKWLDKLDRDPEDLRIPLANTTYPQETEAYWTRLRNANDKLTESSEYKEQVRDEKEDLYNSNKDIFKDLDDSEGELEEVMQEEAFDKDKMREKTLNVDSKIHEAKKKVEKAEAKKADDERKKAEAAKKKAEEQKKKEDAKKKAEQKAKEMKEKTEQTTSQSGQSNSESTSKSSSSGETTTSDSKETEAGEEKFDSTSSDSEEKKSEPSGSGEAAR